MPSAKKDIDDGKDISFKDEQPSKAKLLINFTVNEILTNVKDLQYLNAYELISVFLHSLLY